MAIKNTKLGGTDWGEEYLYYNDLNDTFNAAADYITGLTTFWLNSDLYDVYDDFSGYSDGDNLFNESNWSLINVSGGCSYYFEAENSSQAGGSANEGRLHLHDSNYAGGKTIIISLDGLSSNVHTFIRCYASCSGILNTHNDCNLFQVSFDEGSNYYSMCEIAFNSNAKCSVLMVAKGSNQYDCYLGGQKVQTVTDATPHIYFKMYKDSDDGGTVSTNLYIDDVRQSKSSL